MVSLPRMLLRAATGRPPRLICAPRVWHQGVDELHRRTGGWRESGAFLLGTVYGKTRRIQQFLFYDDIDPTCFARGIVEFDGGKFGLVWQKCREMNMDVVADVHVHPHHFGQSGSDRHNPMMPEAGHLALILPDYAARARMPGKIGVYEYLGARKWRDHSPHGDLLFRVGWWPQ